MIANQGEHNRHYFSHERKSDTNHSIQQCYMSALHKLAQQIIEDSKSVMLPSFGIFGARRVAFEKVEIEERNDRNDMQPDIVGVTCDGKRYLIEILYSHAVDPNKKQKIYADDLTCMEIDISRQDMDSLENFLLNQDSDRKWINNKYDFEDIENECRRQGRKCIKITALPCYAMPLTVKCPELIEVQHRGITYHYCIRSQWDCPTRKQQTEHSQRQHSVNQPVLPHDSYRFRDMVPQPSFVEMGDKTKYPLIPEGENPSLEGYFNNLKSSAHICVSDGIEFVVLNYFQSQNHRAFSVVAVNTLIPDKYIVIVVRESASSFEHIWYNGYEKEADASIAAKKKLGFA